MVKFHTEMGVVENRKDEWFKIAGSAFEVKWLGPIDVKALVDI